MNKAIAGLVAVVVVIALGLWIFGGGDDETANNNEAEQTSQVDEEMTNQPETSNIVELAQQTDDLSILVSAVVKAGLVETLSGDGPFTVFAPTNAAFEALLAELGITADELLAREDLADILTYHVVSAEALSSSLSDGQMVTTVQGGNLTITLEDGGVVKINDAQVITADVAASNGVVHIIDKVLLP